MITSTITSRGPTTLPKPVREALRVRAGDRVRYVILGNEVRGLSVRPVGRLFGALKHLKFRDSLTEMDSRFRGNDGQRKSNVSR